VEIPGLSHGFVSAGDVRLHYVSAGEGPLVLLLHGFPESWYAYRHQIGPLAAAGYRVVAPDLRGYGGSDKPRRVSAYAPMRLVEDVRALVDAFGGRAAAVVGHDWGGVVAYLFAHAHPERLERLVVANAPHPAHFFAGLSDPAQLRRSWYVFFFQLPALPEWYSKAFDHARMRSIFRSDPRRAGAFTDEDIARTIEAVASPEARFGSIAYYRALLRPSALAHIARLGPLAVPVWVLWGEQDRYLGRNLAAPPARLVRAVVLERLPGASHWVLADAPARTNRFLLEALATPA